MKNSLNKTGLSMSQAQSISNLCNQKALEIANTIAGINNATKIVSIDGENYESLVGKPIPANIVDLIMEKAKLHACQAFLMENIKAKANLLNTLRVKSFVTTLEVPQEPTYVTPVLEKVVDEAWGKDQLSISEIAELLEKEAYASHIGQFIHKGCPLDKLRVELPTIKTLEFLNVVEGKKTPVKVTIHHTSGELLEIHTKFAQLHREYESRVNYFKAKISNLVTLENARIAQANADSQNKAIAENNTLRTKYREEYSLYNETLQTQRHEFEKIRQEEIKEAAALRISVNVIFQDTIDSFLKTLPEGEE